MNTSTAIPAAPTRNAISLFWGKQRPKRRRCKDGRQDEKHDAHLVHLSPLALDGKGVSELMEDLEQGIDQPEKQEVRGSQDAVYMFSVSSRQ